MVGLDERIVVMGFCCEFRIVGVENLLDGWESCLFSIWLEGFIVIVGRRGFQGGRHVVVDVCDSVRVKTAVILQRRFSADGM